jgi:hypothetical protein
MDTKIWIVERFDEDSNEHVIIGTYTSKDMAAEHILRDIGREFGCYMKKYPSHFAKHMKKVGAFKDITLVNVQWSDVEYYYRNILLKNKINNTYGIESCFFFEGYGYTIGEYVLDKVHLG